MRRSHSDDSLDGRYLTATRSTMTPRSRSSDVPSTSRGFQVGVTSVSSTGSPVAAARGREVRRNRRACTARTRRRPASMPSSWSCRSTVDVGRRRAGGRPPSFIQSATSRARAPITVDEDERRRCVQRNVRPSVCLLRVEADDVQVVVDADVEIEPGPVARLRRRERVDAVVEFLLPHEARIRVRRRLVLGHLEAIAGERLARRSATTAGRCRRRRGRARAGSACAPTRGTRANAALSGRGDAARARCARRCRRAAARARARRCRRRATPTIRRSSSPIVPGQLLEPRNEARVLDVVDDRPRSRARTAPPRSARNTTPRSGRERARASQPAARRRSSAAPRRGAARPAG